MKRCLFFLIFLMVLSITPALVFAEKAYDKPVSVKEKSGLRFRVPEDWPVEKRGGAVAPIPVEEYLSLRFQSIESRLDSIENTLRKFDILLQEVQDLREELREELEDIKRQQELAE